jgi:hypothetical protein
MSNGTALLAMIVVYKICVLLVGLGLSFMGYRLFMADKTASAGDLTGNIGKYGLSLKGGAPGLFFSLFGAIIIGISVFEGISYDELKGKEQDGQVEQTIPDTPP